MFNRVLILAPHTDDGEFWCGGSIARFIEEKKEVFYIAFSTCEKSLPSNFPKGTLKNELKQATQILGISPKNVFSLNYEVRKFPQYRQEILENMLYFKKKLNPDIVFLPSTTDTHQDHQVISQEGFRAFKTITILGYEIPYNNLSFKTNAFILLKKNHIEKKLKALSCYKSQSERTWISGEFINSLAITRGRQIKTNEYAEAFEVIRLVI